VALERRCFSDPWTENSFREALDSPWSFGLVAHAGQSVAGYLIARELLRSALVRFRKRRVEEVFLEVRESNRSAQALYLSSGFRPVAQRAAYYRNPKEDALVLWLALEQHA
jgi:ribosomal-protein-alanine N-acetyltransferase